MAETRQGGVRGEGAWELGPHRSSTWSFKGTTVPGGVGVLEASGTLCQ